MNPCTLTETTTEDLRATLYSRVAWFADKSAAFHALAERCGIAAAVEEAEGAGMKCKTAAQVFTAGQFRTCRKPFQCMCHRSCTEQVTAGQVYYDTNEDTKHIRLSKKCADKINLMP